LRLVAPEDVAGDWEDRLLAGGLGYGDLKKALFEHYWEYFAEARAKRAELENDLGHVNQVLKDGADKARARATTVLNRARKNCGLA
jgi:tryptophanyl-tRNA synthetase